MEQLHDHNQKTYENICRMYDEGIRRVAVVQPTGSGKSLLMAKLIEDNPNSKFFVLSTRHEINDQFKEKLDEEMLERVDFNIYWNMPNMNQEVMEALQPDYILLDEMHRVLAREWSKGIKRLLEMYPNANVLGLSATPIRYLDKCRNVAEELFGGNLACDMSLSEAILDGILPMARYVCGVYSYEKDAESLNKKIERSYNNEEEKKELLKELKVLKENLDKGNGVSDIFKKYVSGSEKFVVFLKNTTHLRVMKPVIEKWFIDAGFSVRLYEVHCKNTDKDKEFQAFKEDTEDGIVKLCLSVNMVTEGIHGDIDGVIMLRDTISANMYFQMIGRAFSCGKKTIPLIFDLVANSQFISNAADNFPNELRREIEKRKEECEKEGKDYEVGFDVDEFIVMDYFMDVVSGFKAIEGGLKGREWTEEENDIFRKYYLTEGTNIVNRLNGRTRAAIQTHASKLGLNFSNPWMDEEIEILREKFLEIDIMEIIKLLPNHSCNSIKSKAYQLGLIKGLKYVPNDNDDKIIIENYSVYGKKILELLPHMTENQVKHRAKHLGVKFDNKPWTEEEKQILYDNIECTIKELLKLLPNRTAGSIKSMASRLGLTSNRSVNWSNEEDEKLYLYPKQGSKMFKYLPNKSKGQILRRIKQLGIKKEDPFKTKMQLVQSALLEGVVLSKNNQFYKGVNLYEWKISNRNKFTAEELEIVNKVIPPARKLAIKVVDFETKWSKIYSSQIAAAHALHEDFHILKSKESIREAIQRRLSGKVTTPYKGRFMFYYATDEEIKKYREENEAS